MDGWEADQGVEAGRKDIYGVSRVSGDTCNLVTKKIEDRSCCGNGGECDYFQWLDLGERRLFS